MQEQEHQHHASIRTRKEWSIDGARTDLVDEVEVCVEAALNLLGWQQHRGPVDPSLTLAVCRSTCTNG